MSMSLNLNIWASKAVVDVLPCVPVIPITSTDEDSNFRKFGLVKTLGWFSKSLKKVDSIFIADETIYNVSLL